MQARTCQPVFPWAFGRPLRPAAAPNQQRIACANAKPGEFLPCLEILHIDRCTRLQPFDVLEQRHVHENSAGNIAWSHSVGGRFSTSRSGEREREAVVAHCWLAGFAPDRTLIMA